MRLTAEIPAHYLTKEDAQIIFPGLHLTAKEIVQSRTVQALEQIQESLKDTSIEDPECFTRIEEIVFALKEIGLSCGERHDFG